MQVEGRQQRELATLYTLSLLHQQELPHNDQSNTGATALGLTSSVRATPTEHTLGFMCAPAAGVPGSAR
jgi:hypothetical protein